MSERAQNRFVLMVNAMVKSGLLPEEQRHEAAAIARAFNEVGREIRNLSPAEVHEISVHLSTIVDARRAVKQ